MRGLTSGSDRESLDPSKGRQLALKIGLRAGGTCVIALPSGLITTLRGFVCSIWDLLAQYFPDWILQATIVHIGAGLHFCSQNGGNFEGDLEYSQNHNTGTRIEAN